MDSEPAVRLQNVVFAFKKQQPVLDNISVAIPRGAIYCLLGPSGCGKTTILKVIWTEVIGGQHVVGCRPCWGC